MEPGPFLQETLLKGEEVDFLVKKNKTPHKEVYTYGKLPQSGGGNTLKKGMVMVTIGDHAETKDPLIEEDTLAEDPLMEEEDPLDPPEGKDYQALKELLSLQGQLLYKLLR